MADRLTDSTQPGRLLAALLLVLICLVVGGHHLVYLDFDLRGFTDHDLYFTRDFFKIDRMLSGNEPGVDGLTDEPQRSRRTGNLLLMGREAAGEEEGAEGRRTDLTPRLNRAPDLSSTGAGRRRSSGYSGGRRALVEVGIFSGGASGAS